MEELNDHTARLELNARGHHYDEGMERVADLIDTDRAAFLALPARVQSAASVYHDFREHHRAAVAAGVITEEGSGAH